GIHPHVDRMYPSLKAHHVISGTSFAGFSFYGHSWPGTYMAQLHPRSKTVADHHRHSRRRPTFFRSYRVASLTSSRGGVRAERAAKLFGGRNSSVGRLSCTAASRASLSNTCRGYICSRAPRSLAV